MTRKKVKLAFIENNAERKASYKKRQKGFLNKAHELSTLCDIEIATAIYSPYHEEPVVFPNHEATFNTFTKFRELPEHVQSRNMVTQERFTRIRIKKIDEQLRKIKKENRVMELTNQMYALLNGEDIPTNMHLYNLNDLSYVINQNLKQVDRAIKAKAHMEGSTSNVPQPISRPMVLGENNSERLKAPPLLAYNGTSVSGVPFLAPSNALSVSNFEKPRAPSLVSDVAPISMVPLVDKLMIPSAAAAQVSQSMFHLVDHLRSTPPRTTPLVDPSHVPSSFSSQIFPPIISQSYPLVPHQMALRRAPEVAPPIPLTTMASPMSSSMMPPLISAPMFSPNDPQIEHLMNVPSTSSSGSTNNYQNYSLGFPQSFTFSEMLNRNDDDDIMALLDDPSFNYINFQDPNRHNNNF